MVSMTSMTGMPSTARTIGTTIAACAAFLTILLVATAAAADRLIDKDIKALLARIDDERDRFEDQLVASLVSDGRPASGEAQQVLDRAARVQATSAGRSLSPAATTAWSLVGSGLDKVAQAFGLSRRIS